MRATFYVRLFVLFATISTVLSCGSSSGGGGSRSGGGSDNSGGFFDDSEDDSNTGDNNGEGGDLPDGDLGDDNPDDGNDNGEDGGFLDGLFGGDDGGGFLDGLFGDNDDDSNTGDDNGEGGELLDEDVGDDNPDNDDGNGGDGGFLDELFGGFPDGLFEGGDGTDNVDDNGEDGGFLGELFGGDDDDNGGDVATSIVGSARNSIGSTRYSTESSYGPGSGKYKCNYFVHDILESVGAPAPERRSSLIPGSYPISAETWGDPTTPKEGFQLVGNNPSDARPGDVASNGHHVGIVSREGHTISASSRENKVVENEWGFHDTDNVLFWRPLAQEQK